MCLIPLFREASRPLFRRAIIGSLYSAYSNTHGTISTTTHASSFRFTFYTFTFTQYTWILNTSLHSQHFIIMRSDLESRLSKSVGTSPKTKIENPPKYERVNSQYLESFVFGSASPRQQELLTIGEHFDDQRPPACDVNKALPPHPANRSRLLGARRVTLCVCASIFFILAITLALNISIPIILRQHKNAHEDRSATLSPMLLEPFATIHGQMRGPTWTSGVPLVL
ncbi:hypothetical protein PSPO01_10050 [Paraphaeosphaeria sporulosa]